MDNNFLTTNNQENINKYYSNLSLEDIKQGNSNYFFILNDYQSPVSNLKIIKDKYYFVINFNLQNKGIDNRNCFFSYQSLNQFNLYNYKLNQNINHPKLKELYYSYLQTNDYTLGDVEFIRSDEFLEDFRLNFNKKTNLTSPTEQEIRNRLTNIDNGKFFEYLELINDQDISRDSNLNYHNYLEIKNQLTTNPLLIYQYPAKINLNLNSKNLTLKTNEDYNSIQKGSKENNNLLNLLLNSCVVVTNKSLTQQIIISDMFTIIDIKNNLEKDSNLELIKLYNTGVLAIYNNLIPHLNSNTVSRQLKNDLELIKSNLFYDKEAIIDVYYRPVFSRLHRE